jgi:hypothetical protein
VWMESKKPHIWDDDPRLTLDVRSVPINRTSFPCGEKRDNSSTGLSTLGCDSHPIHILEPIENHAHIWGCEFLDIFSLPSNCPQRKVLIHK